MQPTVIIVGPTILDRDILTIDVTGLPHAAIECSELLAPGSGRAAVEESDNRHRLLRTRRERPCRRAAEQRDERAPPHSISSSARPDSGSGTVMPSVLAVLRLMNSSTFVACCTGRSAGFSPLRTRPA